MKRHGPMDDEARVMRNRRKRHRAVHARNVRVAIIRMEEREEAKKWASPRAEQRRKRSPEAYEKRRWRPVPLP